MQLLTLLASWVVLALLSAMSFPFQRQFSDSERDRLAELGDRAALAEVARLQEVPLLQSLQWLAVSLATTGFVAIAISLYGVTIGIFFAAVGVVAVPFAYRLPFVCQAADWVARQLTPVFRWLIGYARPLLGWLRQRELPAERVRLNSQVELLKLLRESPQVLSADELQRLEANLTFDQTSVADVMTPRSMIAGVEARETLGPLVLDELYKTGHSRFPVYKKDLDHMVGMLYLHDLVDLKAGEKTVAQAMHKKVYYVHERQPLSRALVGFLKTHHHLFVVVNDYRETVGLLSLEDTIEKLIGKTIIDEFDAYDDLRAVAAHNPHKNNLPINRQDI